MNELEIKWIAALRSGEYEQANGILRRGNTYCCLGVLCDIYDNTKWQLIDNDYYQYKIDNVKYILPAMVFEELSSNCPNQKVLSHMNDNGSNFLEIADTIEMALTKGVYNNETTESN